MSDISPDALLFRRDGTELPPRVLRAAGPLFGSDDAFLSFARRDVVLLADYVALQEGSILDFGCGAGRFYYGLSASEEPARYLGLDVRKDVVDWARSAIQSKNSRFQFSWADVSNERYNPLGKLGNDGWLADEENSKFDIIYSYSVFSHLALDDAARVLGMFSRCCHSQSVLLLTAFVGSQLDPVVINPPGIVAKCDGPLHVVRYQKDFWEGEMLQKFRIVDLLEASATDGQHTYLLRPRF